MQAVLDSFRVVMAISGAAAAVITLLGAAKWSGRPIAEPTRSAFAAMVLLAISASYTSLTLLGEAFTWRFPFALLGEMTAVAAAIQLVRLKPTDSYRPVAPDPEWG